MGFSGFSEDNDKRRKHDPGFGLAMILENIWMYLNRCEMEMARPPSPYVAAVTLIDKLIKDVSDRLTRWIVVVSGADGVL